MTLTAEQAKADKELIWLFEVELLYRLETKTWTQAASPNTACWYVAHSTEGKPNRVRQLVRATHVITTYAEQTSLANCQAVASSWFYDTANGRLYVHTSVADSPATSNKYYISSHFWKRFVTAQREAPNTVYDADGYFIEPRLRVYIPEYSQEVNDFKVAGVKQTWSAVFVANPDAKFDADLATYVWAMRPCYLKVGAKGDTIANYVTVARGRTGSIGWTDSEIEIRVEDQLRAED